MAIIQKTALQRCKFSQTGRSKKDCLHKSFAHRKYNSQSGWRTFTYRKRRYRIGYSVLNFTQWLVHENHTGSISGVLAAGAVFGSAGNGKFSSAARADFAEAAVVVLTETGHEGKIYELAGDEAYSLAEYAAEIAKQTGKKIVYNNLPVSEYAKILESFGLPGFIAEAIAGWDVSASKGDLYDDSHTLSKLIERPTTPMAEVVKNALAALKWHKNNLWFWIIKETKNKGIPSFKRWNPFSFFCFVNTCWLFNQSKSPFILYHWK